MMMGLFAFVGAAILCGVAVFTFFGSYWYQLWRKDNSDYSDSSN